MITIKLTYTPIKVAYTVQVKNSATVADIVAACKEKWGKTHDRSESERKTGNQLAVAFAEFYTAKGKYDDDKSGELTSALDKAAGYDAKPIAPVPVVADKAAPKAKKPATKASKAYKAKVAAKGKVSKAEQVREMIRANPKKDVTALIAIAVADLGMTNGKAKTYVTENVVRVRGA